MDIKEKLSYYRSVTQQSAFESAKGPEPALKVLCEHYNGQICAPEAPYLRIDRVYQSDWFSHANDSISLNLLSKGQITTAIPMDGCLFFDLETTGLAGGAGTFAFLLGFGVISDGQLQVRQYFLPDYGREYYFFKQLTVWLRSFRHLVSYNGKSYDLPLLKNRLILNRFNPDFDHLKHIDLLHILRRLWKDELPSIDLQTMESVMLKRLRENDIPGYQIPQAYFEFVRSGVVHNIIRMIEHNYWDIVSLAEMFISLGSIEEDPMQLRNENARLRLAGLAFEQKNEQQFRLIYRYADRFSAEGKWMLNYWQSFFHKRAGRWSEAVSLWESLVQTRIHGLIALEELAKYHEHEAKDPAQALHFTDKALQLLNIFVELHGYQTLPGQKQAFVRRRLRLLSKLA